MIELQNAQNYAQQILKIFQTTINEYIHNLFVVFGQINYQLKSTSNMEHYKSFQISTIFYVKNTSINIFSDKIYANKLYDIWINFHMCFYSYYTTFSIDISKYEDGPNSKTIQTPKIEIKDDSDEEKQNIINVIKKAIYSIFKATYVNNEKHLNNTFYFTRNMLLEEMGIQNQENINVNIYELFDKKIKRSLGNILVNIKYNKNAREYHLINDFILYIASKNGKTTIKLEKTIDKEKIKFFTYKIIIETIENEIELQRLYFIVDAIILKTNSILYHYQLKYNHRK